MLGSAGIPSVELAIFMGQRRRAPESKPAREVRLLVEPTKWHGSCLGSECTFHQISPYIGKMKSSMARVLVEEYSEPGDLILDPFSGSGSIALESLIGGREIICIDKNLYAVTLTRAKLYAPQNSSEAISRARSMLDSSHDVRSESLKQVPSWVKSFFHPRTLRETLQAVSIVRRSGDSFLMACILGILHHERPGFLSYPSSHLVPYLRAKKYPRHLYPDLYGYRALEPRLVAKIARLYRRPATYSRSLVRACLHCDMRRVHLKAGSLDAIITSPPYMDTLDYVRDNRLRLWFLGIENGDHQDREFSSVRKFSALMTDFFGLAKRWLRKRGKCVVVVGDVGNRQRSVDVARIVQNVATSYPAGFKLESIATDRIPDIRRTRRGSHRTQTESVVVLRRR